MNKNAIQYLRDQLENAIDNYGAHELPEVAIEAMVKDPIARGHLVNLILEEMAGDDRALLISWGMFVDDQATDEERDHWQIWVGPNGGWVTVSFLYKGTYGASLKNAPPGLKVIARFAPDECTAHLRCLAPNTNVPKPQVRPVDVEEEDAYDEHFEAMDYDHLNYPGR